MILYGIKNCDTVKKARKWLEQHNIDYRFHDFRVDGLDKNKLNAWTEVLGWEALLNKRGTTFRKLPDPDKNKLTEAKAIELMLKQPTLIKRPVMGLGNTVLIGFDETHYLKTLNA